MKKFKITTESTAISVYWVEAETEEEAKEKFQDSEYENEEIVDYQNEDITNIEQV